MREVVREFTKGDTLVAPQAELWKADGAPLDLTVITSATVLFRMVPQAGGTAKIDDAAAAIVTNGSASTPAVVKYVWQPADVDTAGEFWAWFIVRDSVGKTEHFPQGKKFKISIKDEA